TPQGKRVRYRLNYSLVLDFVKGRLLLSMGASKRFFRTRRREKGARLEKVGKRTRRAGQRELISIGLVTEQQGGVSRLLLWLAARHVPAAPYVPWLVPGQTLQTGVSESNATKSSLPVIREKKGARKRSCFL